MNSHAGKEVVPARFDSWVNAETRPRHISLCAMLSTWRATWGSLSVGATFDGVQRGVGR